MKTDNFAAWCDAAVGLILFPADREAVRRELMDHLLDHCDDLVDQGLDRETARQLALDAMGDAAEIAPQLAAIHRPFWGYFLRFTQIALAVMACAVLLCLGIRAWNNAGTHYPATESFDPYTADAADMGYSARTRLFYAEPGVSVQSDGYTLTLTRAAVWYHKSEDEDTFYCQMEVFNPRPWAEHTDIGTRFHAVDSLGYVYDSDYGRIPNRIPHVSSGMSRTGLLTSTQYIWISDYISRDAEWIEFRYQRSGRELAWRIDLTGGDGP